jgi:hypothetical protein
MFRYPRAAALKPRPLNIAAPYGYNSLSNNYCFGSTPNVTPATWRRPQQECLRHLIVGRSSSTIAEAMRVSESTVRFDADRRQRGEPRRARRARRLYAFSRSPLSRAYRPFIGSISKGSSGSRLCENVGWVRILMG